jgi:hypothetical protein
VAAHLRETLGVEAELVRGGSGELSVWVDGTKVIEKMGQAFPTVEECELAVAKVMQGGA